MALPVSNDASPPVVYVLCSSEPLVTVRWLAAERELNRGGVHLELTEALPPYFDLMRAEAAASQAFNDERSVLVISPAHDPRRNALFGEQAAPRLMAFLTSLESHGRIAFLEAEGVDLRQLPRSLRGIPAFKLADHPSIEALVRWVHEAVAAAARRSADITDPVRQLVTEAEFLEQRGDLRGAVEAVRQALEIAASTQDQSAIAALSFRLAELLLSAGDLTGAMETVREGLSIAERLDDAATLSKGLRILGNIQAAFQDWSNALATYERALEMARRAQDVPGQWLTLIAMGDAHQQMGNAEQALGLFNHALVIAKISSDPKIIEGIESRIAAVSKPATPATPPAEANNAPPEPAPTSRPKPRAKSSSSRASNAAAAGQPPGNPPHPTDPPDSSDPISIEALRAYSLSSGAQAVLDRAKTMTPPGGRWSTLSTLAFLFAFKELGRETPQNQDTVHFVHRYIDRQSGQRYQSLYESTVSRWMEDSPPGLGTKQAPGSWVRAITVNVQRMFDRAREIARRTLLRQTDIVTNPALARDSDTIHARHLFAALLTFQPEPGKPNSVVEKLTYLGIDLAAMKTALFEIVAANTLEDFSQAWEQELGPGSVVHASTEVAPVIFAKVPVTSTEPNVASPVSPLSTEPDPSSGLAPWLMVDSFRWSSSADAVLQKARSLAEAFRGGAGVVVTVDHLLFAFAEIGGRPEENGATARWLRGLVDGSDPRGYSGAFADWVRDHESAASQAPASAATQPHLTREAARVLVLASDLAGSTLDPATAAASTTVQGVEIHARHLLAAAVVSSEEGGDFWRRLRVSPAHAALRLFEYVRAAGINDKFEQWSRVLGVDSSRKPAPTDKPAAPVELPERFRLNPAAREAMEMARRLAATREEAPGPVVDAMALLFGLAEAGANTETNPIAAQFRRYLTRKATEPYHRARFQYFRSGDRALSGDQPPDVGVVRGVSPDAITILDEAVRIAGMTNVGLAGTPDGDTMIYPQHLAAAFITTAASAASPPHRAMLDGIQMPPAEMARAMCADLLRSGPYTPIASWKAVLRPVLGETVQELLPDAFRVTFDNDQNQTDRLNLKHEIDALASLVAARAVRPPLAIGLFGEWGSGKSFFMSRLRDRVTELAGAARAGDARAEAQAAAGQARTLDPDKTEWHRHICQIEFNAWHYVEGNIWASLVEHIFSSLRSSLVSPKASAEAQRKQEEEFRREFETSKHALAELESRIRSAQQDLDNAQAAVAQARDDHRLKASLLGELKSGQTALVVVRSLIDNAGFKSNLRELGLTEDVMNSPARVREEIQKLSAEIDAWRSPISLIAGRAIQSRLIVVGILGLLLLVTPVVIVFVMRLLSEFDREIKLVVGLAIQFAAVCTAVLGWVGTQAARLAKARAKLEPVMRQLEEHRSEELVRTERELSAAKTNLDQAVSDHALQQKKVEELKAQEKAATATELMAQFIEQRAACTDYRRHLGITAIVRRDFAKLTELVEQRASEARTGPVDEMARQPIDRIVLYIDDLDRCPPDKVVAVLEAIHLILAFKLFVVVVGVDARWVSHSLKKKYGSLLSGGMSGRTRGGEPGERVIGSSSQTPTAVPEDYLEKIFQVPFRLRSLSASGTRSLLDHLVKPAGPASTPARREASTPAAAGASAVSGASEARSDATARAASGHLVETKLPVAASGGPSVPIAVTPRGDVAAATPTTTPVTPVSPTSSGPAITPTTGPAPQRDRPADIATSSPSPSSAFGPATVAGQASALAAGSVTAGAQYEPPAVELAPGLLQLTENEIRFMMELAPVIGRSPRAVHRFVNCYRLLKAARDPRAVADFETALDPSSVPPYEAAMMMLGLVIGIPEIAAPALKLLVAHGPNQELSVLITAWDKHPRIAAEPDWHQRIAPFFNQYAGKKGRSCPIRPFREAAASVARYSFRTGMMEELEVSASPFDLTAVVKEEAAASE